MKIKLLGNATEEAIKNYVKVVATAARISRTKGKAIEIYDEEHTFKENLKTIGFVLNSGHTSISDHDYLVFALEDVTPIVEQTLIGYRLTSFTIKSRREVNFTEEGYYLPNFRGENSEELETLYAKHANKLFELYGKLVNSGVPFQDARYILPYSFHANIIMGMDATELKRVLDDLLHGELAKYQELRELGEQIYTIVKERAPYLVPVIDKSKLTCEDNLDFLDGMLGEVKATKNLESRIVDCDMEGDLKLAITTLAARYQLSYEDATTCLLELSKKDPDVVEKIIRGVVFNHNNRELEAVNYQIEFASSLAVLTHFTRHRMHSLLVPDFVPMWDLNRYKIPDSIQGEQRFLCEKAFAENAALCEEFRKRGVNEYDLVYFYMAGNVVNVRTTINAKTLIDISRKRTCRKTQWETREIVEEWCRQAKEITPIIGKYLGPSCEVLGHCPEGKDSCKRGVQKLVLEADK